MQKDNVRRKETLFPQRGLQSEISFTGTTFFETRHKRRRKKRKKDGYATYNDSAGRAFMSTYTADNKIHPIA
jgi:hypothetical protein